MGATVGLMTVEEFRSLPEDPGVRRELHDGEVFEMTRPTRKHWAIQNSLVSLLRVRVGDLGVVGMEVSFRPTPEHSIWAADVAFVTRERWNASPLEDDLHGAPDLVIEVASPSNTALEFERREQMCMRNGCREFWIVYPELELVRVSSGSQVTRYERGSTIELTLIPGVRIAVDDIFPPTASA
jgi:Uma2 family endonuclease